MNELDKEYSKLSAELFTVEVIYKGNSEIYTNFTEIQQFNWDKLTLHIIKKYKFFYYLV